MKRYLFPRDVITEESRVVIYGAGKICRQYISQIIGEEINVHIVCVVDHIGFVREKKLHDAMVYPLEMLSKIAPDDYDYILIAIENTAVVAEVKNLLHRTGIPENKIVHAIRAYQEIKSLEDPEILQYSRPSFSWSGEDVIIWDIFARLGINAPTYLDIGCNHPYVCSNTALFYLTGSHGVNIDANINCIRLMEQERPDDCNLCCGIAVEDGEKDFYMVGDLDQGNSFFEHFLAKNCRNGALVMPEHIPSHKVKCHTLQTIVERYCGSVFPDFFDLDIEGMDADVIGSYDFSLNGPKVICAEILGNQQAQGQLLSQGYIKFFETRHNAIFLRKEYSDIFILM